MYCEPRRHRHPYRELVTTCGWFGSAQLSSCTNVQVRSLLGQVRADRQTLLFSATMPRKVEALVRDAVTEPVRMTVGGAGANEDIRQVRMLHMRRLGVLLGLQSKHSDERCCSLRAWWTSREKHCQRWCRL